MKAKKRIFIEEFIFDFQSGTKEIIEAIMWFLERKDSNQRLVVLLYIENKKHRKTKRFPLAPFEEIYIDDNPDISFFARVIENKLQEIVKREKIVVGLFSERFNPVTLKKENN